MVNTTTSKRIEYKQSHFISNDRHLSQIHFSVQNRKGCADNDDDDDVANSQNSISKIRSRGLDNRIHDAFERTNEVTASMSIANSLWIRNLKANSPMQRGEYQLCVQFILFQNFISVLVKIILILIRPMRL